MKDFNHDLFYKKIKIYSLILSSLRELEKTMSFPIFIVFIFHSLAIFSWLAWAILKDIFSYKTAIVAAFSILIICLISIAAAKVNEADKYAKYTNDQMLQKIQLSNETSELDIKLRFMDFNNRPPFALSAWGYFYFTRSFFFIALGNLLAYALLIINIGH